MTFPLAALPRILIAGALVLTAVAAWSRAPFQAHAASLSSEAAFVDALTWGVTEPSLADYRAKGRDAWLREQLHPSGPPSLPAEIQAQIDAGRSRTSLSERFAAYQARTREASAIPDADTKRAARVVNSKMMLGEGRRTVDTMLLRGLYSPNQLHERMTWFWANRFSLFSGLGYVSLLLDDYVETAIRPHAFGRFRDLVEASLKQPAMLRYLDNYANTAGKLNENYARELLELHTMGVGSGYSQADIENLARILTGVGYDGLGESPNLIPERQQGLIREDLFVFHPKRHDFGDKVFLGRTIRGRGWAEVEEVLDIVCKHPATARNVSRALARYFMVVEPSDALVERLASAFARSDGETAIVLDELFRSPEFEASLGRQFKDPTRFVLSALRLSFGDRIVVNTQPILNWLKQLGQAPFGRTTPDGYPLAASAWNGPDQMLRRFEIARQIGAGAPTLFKRADATDQAAPRVPILNDAFYAQAFADRMNATAREALAKADKPQDWNMLFLSSPEFMQ